MTGSCDGTSVGTGNNLVVSPSNTTTYYGRWENSCGNSTCQTVTVNVSSLTTSVIIEASTHLQYATAHLLLIKPYQQMEVLPTYQWKVNGTNVGTNSQTYTYVPLNGDQVSVVLTSSDTCAQPILIFRGMTIQRQLQIGLWNRCTSGSGQYSTGGVGGTLSLAPITSTKTDIDLTLTEQHLSLIVRVLITA
jgi:hypothetical protein